jgi:hypothetical protein
MKRSRSGPAGEGRSTGSGPRATPCDALKEYTCERVRLQWASSLGDEGAGLSLLAKRVTDAALVQMAIRQIDFALKTAREGTTREIGRVPRGGITQGSRTFRSVE